MGGLLGLGGRGGEVLARFRALDLGERTALGARTARERRRAGRRDRRAREGLAALGRIHPGDDTHADDAPVEDDDAHHVELQDDAGDRAA